MAQTLYDKIWDRHVVKDRGDGVALIYIDRHLTHEVTTPQAYDGLRAAGRKLRRTDAVIAVPDHNVPTKDRHLENPSKTSAEQLEALEANSKEFGVEYIPMEDIRQGIVHVIGPEQGITQPGITLVCGDSHTATHGAFGALAFGIGTSEIEHVFATQTLQLKKSKAMKVDVTGALQAGVTAKDLVLHIIGLVGTAGGTGHVIEFCGKAITDLSMEGRMTVCNMAIEAGARAGLIAPDEKTYSYLKGRSQAPKADQWDAALKVWGTLYSDPDAQFDTVVTVNATDVPPTITWGTSPEDTVSVTGVVPAPESFDDVNKQKAVVKSLDYMGLTAGTAVTDIPIDRVFIGSCTNSRIEDLRAAASIIKGKKVADHIIAALVVPGSGLVKKQAEDEGLDQVFLDAGFEWREPGCSMCLGMNPDIAGPGERVASTSNRNFVGRQGTGARTHLVSPEMAAAAAIAGKFVDVREI